LFWKKKSLGGETKGRSSNRRTGEPEKKSKKKERSKDFRPSPFTTGVKKGASGEKNGENVGDGEEKPWKKRGGATSKRYGAPRAWRIVDGRNMGVLVKGAFGVSKIGRAARKTKNKFPRAS